MSTRKNKTNMVVNWPIKTIFSIQDIFDANADCKEITLRTRLSKEIELGNMAEIGYVQGVAGRPPKRFARTPITKTLLDMAESSSITLIDRAREKFINAINITSSAPTAPTAPVTLGIKQSVKV